MADVRRILVVVAHPDDAEFGCAGSVARWVADGCEVHYCLFTSGNRGSDDPAMTPERLAAVRETEQRAAGRSPRREERHVPPLPRRRARGHAGGPAGRHPRDPAGPAGPDRHAEPVPEPEPLLGSPRPPARGPPRARRGLSLRARSDALPRAARGGIRAPQGSRGLSHGSRRAGRRHRHHGHHGPEARGAPVPRRASSGTSPEPRAASASARPTSANRMGTRTPRRSAASTSRGRARARLLSLALAVGAVAAAAARARAAEPVPEAARLLGWVRDLSDPRWRAAARAPRGRPGGRAISSPSSGASAFAPPATAADSSSASRC